MSWELIKTYLLDRTILASVIAAIGSVVVAVFAYRAVAKQRGTYSDHVQAAELASKRLEFWSKYTELSELANGARSAIHSPVLAEAAEAASRIKEDADEVMCYLSWQNEITQRIQKPRTRGWLSLGRFFAKFIQWILMAGAVLIFAHLFLRILRLNTSPVPFELAVKLFAIFGLFILLVIASAWFARLAEEERYPRPALRVIKRI